MCFYEFLKIMFSSCRNDFPRTRMNYIRRTVMKKHYLKEYYIVLKEQRNFHVKMLRIRCSEIASHMNLLLLELELFLSFPFFFTADDFTAEQKL